MSKEKTTRNKKIIALRKKGLSYRQLAKIFNIDSRAVFDIVNRKKINALRVVDNRPIDKR